MEKFNELNMKILEDDGSSNLSGIMKEIMKEILLEQEEQKKKGIILPTGGGAGGSHSGAKSVSQKVKDTTKSKKSGAAGKEEGQTIDKSSIGEQSSRVEDSS